ncbi:hypothetical protein CFN78_16405 [Amycolatopsis antarctica]|uniref:Alpha/beta hydrolase n=1 Tax=Amycolatopsis antarctica TaxID=1854586 RepID=A0A263D1A2_9PSEU|nr:hypothetical protein [Amycolatopsis antarctica]OZM72121.1 hypothetical protein CFN78_16405 [Amycolatopsis antarctica]
MAEVVLVHGIGQQQQTPDSLEQAWLPQLAGGVRLFGCPDLADQLWRASRPGELDVRMAFYGDLFVKDDQQGDADDADLPERAQRIFDTLEVEIAQHAAERSTDPHDRREAERALAALVDQADQQGIGAGLRPVLNSLVRIRPLARLGTAFAGSVLRTALRQVSLYLSDDVLREQVQARVAAHLTPDTAVLIGHSLGSVVAYEAAHRLGHPLPLLLTLGSPLGLRNIVYDHLRPQPPTVPPQVRRWVNVADRDDIVAASLDLTSRFPGDHGVLENTYTVDNGARPHDATFYLNKKTVAQAITAALATSRPIDVG